MKLDLKKKKFLLLLFVIFVVVVTVDMILFCFEGFGGFEFVRTMFVSREWEGERDEWERCEEQRGT